MSNTTDTTARAAEEHGAKDRAREQAGQVADRGRQEASEVARVAKSETAELARRTGSELRSRADDQTGKLAGVLGSLADELDEMASASDQRSGYMKHLAQDGASASRRVAQRLEHDGFDGALNDVEQFARRRPGMFLAAAFGTGLLLGRVTRNADLGRIADEARHDGDRMEGRSAAGTQQPMASSLGTTGAGTAGARAAAPGAASTASSGTAGRPQPTATPRPEGGPR